MQLRAILIAANAVLVCLAIVQLVMLSSAGAPGNVMASWKDRPTSLAQTTKLAETVVTGRVKRIRKADPIVTKLEGEPGGIDSIPVEVVTLELIDDDVKGKGRKGGTVELFHTGHSDAESPAARKPPREPPPPKPEEGAVEQNKAVQSREPHMAVLFSGVMEDPAYKMGEEYVLFVRKGPTLTVEGQQVQTQGIVSPEGRFRVKKDKTLEPMSQREFARRYRGKSAKELRDGAAKTVRPGER